MHTYISSPLLLKVILMIKCNTLCTHKTLHYPLHTPSSQVTNTKEPTTPAPDPAAHLPINPNFHQQWPVHFS